MNAILTVCQNCLAEHLAEEAWLGRKVRCTNCGKDFICEKQKGPFPWVLESEGEIPDGSFVKNISRTLFTYGVSVPLAHQNLFAAHVGIPLSKGQCYDVSIQIGDGRYRAVIVSFDGKKGEPKLHFKWKRSDDIVNALKVCLPGAYRYFMINNCSGCLTGSKIIMSLGERISEFVLSVQSLEMKKVIQGDLFKDRTAEDDLSILRTKSAKALLSDISEC